MQFNSNFACVRSSSYALFATHLGNPIIVAGYSSGQRGQTVNLLASPSKVRILPPPPPLKDENPLVRLRDSRVESRKS